MTRGEPFETNLNGPTWMVQLWVTMVFSWASGKPNVEFPEGAASARILAEASPTPLSPAYIFLEFSRLGPDSEYRGDL